MPLTISQASVVEDLQKGVPDIRVRLLDLVEEYHPVGPPSDSLGQLTALFIANISWGRAEQT